MKDGFGAYAGIGMELAASIIGCMLLGWWLDGYFGTEPWLVVTGSLLGLVGGFYNMLKALLNLGRKESGKDKK